MIIRIMSQESGVVDKGIYLNDDRMKHGLFPNDFFLNFTNIY